MSSYLSLPDARQVLEHAGMLDAYADTAGRLFLCVISRSCDEQLLSSDFREFSDTVPVFLIPVRLHEVDLESQSPEMRSRI